MQLLYASFKLNKHDKSKEREGKKVRNKEKKAQEKTENEENEERSSFFSKSDASYVSIYAYSQDCCHHPSPLLIAVCTIILVDDCWHAGID